MDLSVPQIRLAELIGALSLATDFGMGQPLEFALRSCVVALRLAEKLGFDENGMRDVYYQSLLRYIGCNAETRLLAAVFGDELALRTEIIHTDPTTPAYFQLSRASSGRPTQAHPPFRCWGRSWAASHR